jgi:cysteinyl-tRNA synthetase
MSKKHLGTTIDLHSGGVDLLFPHHENEIAQSQCCNGTTFSRHWYHSEFLLVDGKKMSKSLGNLYTLDDLKAKGFSPMAIRYALLSGHPRKQLNFTLESLHAAESAITTLSLDRARMTAFSKDAPTSPSNRFDPVLASLRDDLNAPAALGALFVATKSGPTQSGDLSAFDRALFALGLDLSAQPLQISAPAEICALAERRWTAKKAKDYATADALRKELAAAGWSMLDGKDGYKLEPVKK